MDTLGRGIDAFFKGGKRPTSERAHLMQNICDTLFDDTHFKKILGQTKQFTTQEIRDIFNQAKSWEINPRALFWKLVREKQIEVKKQLKSASKK